MTKKIFPKIVIACLVIGIIFEIAVLYKPAKINAQDRAQSIKISCGGRTGHEKCYADSMGELTKKNEFNYSLSVLEELQKIDPATRGCHLIAHSMSIAEAEKNPKEWKSLLTSMNINMCSGGFVHGVLEAKARLDSTFDIDGPAINDICLYLKEKYGGVGEQNCAHIMGHLVLSAQAGNIPNGVKICDSIKDSMKYECFSGVFMENETRENLIVHIGASHIPWNEEYIQKQEDICRQYKDIAAAACWREVSHMYASITREDPEQVYKMCQRAQDARFASDCFMHGIGIMVASSRTSQDTLKNVCTPFGNNMEKIKSCFEWAIGSLMASSDQYVDRVVTLCTNIPDSLRIECYEKLGRAVSQNMPDKTASICNQIPEGYKNKCLNPSVQQSPVKRLDMNLL